MVEIRVKQVSTLGTILTRLEYYGSNTIVEVGRRRGIALYLWYHTYHTLLDSIGLERFLELCTV